jgi:hypothetical protein
MRTFQHPDNGEHAVASGEAADLLLADGWAELDVEAPSEPQPKAKSKSKPEADPEADPEPDPEPDPDPDPDPDPEPGPDLGKLKLAELIEHAEKIGVAADEIAALRKPGVSKAKAIDAINAHVAAASA